MTALAAHARPLHPRRLAAAVALASALAALAGVLLSQLVSPDPDSTAPATRVVEAGPARVVMPSAWQPVAPAERARGLDSQRLAVLSRSSDLSTMAVVAFGAPDRRSLIPRALGQLVDAPRSEPRVTSLAGQPAWVYRALDARHWNLVMDVTVVPTTTGMLAFACAAPKSPGDGCPASVKSVAVRGATALEPSPTVALAAQLPDLLAGFDRARVDGRAALSHARTREAQAAALQGLADRHLAAADRLRTEFGTPSRPLLERLEEIGRAYAALGAAASDGSPSRFDAARHELRVAEAALVGDVDRVRDAGARDTAAVRAPSPTATEPSRAFVTQPMFVIFLLLGSCAAGFALSGRLADTIARVRRVRSHAARH